ERSASISRPAAETARMSVIARSRTGRSTVRSSHTCSATRGRAAFPSVPAPRTSHAYNAWSARARARVSILIRDVQPVEQVRHLERRERGVPALVAVGAAGAGRRLIDGVAGEHA